MKQLITFILAGLLLSTGTTAQSVSSKNKSNWYVTDAGDLATVSFSNVSRNGNQLTNMPRLVMLYSSTLINHDFSEDVGVFFGFSGRNLGLIYNDNDSVRFKRRVITLGVPAGFKFGNLEKGTYLFVGAEADFAINYKEKRFLNGKKTDKSNTWFGKQTPLFMPSVFAGFVVHHLGLKAQYFPNNFFNPSYQSNNQQPFAGMEAQIFALSLCYDLPRGRKK
ncbi:MAG TPA: hypothetical protein PKE63_08530 [Lacibacter sp.]|nr:hypothetical protein [Lacibacter sp.]HMO88781.1 hypothetical protein [Lacibacter sp.]HMP87309.1 hypothetical protein [Lacibacter sp.]